MHLRLSRLLALAVAGVVLLTGCSSGDDSATATATAPATSGATSVRMTQQKAPATDQRAAAAMPKRVDDAAYQYAQALMKLPTDQLELTYMAEIIPHHQAVIDMATVALTKSQRPELKALANSMIASQKAQIAGYTGLLKDNYGVTPQQALDKVPQNIQTILDQVNKGLAQKIDRIQQAPADAQFDQLWLQEVVPHHQTAILESQPVQDAAATPQLVLMANMAVGGQEMQIAQMMNWLVQWYGMPS